MGRKGTSSSQARSGKGENAFQLLLGRLPIPAWIQDAKSLNFLEINDALARLLGYRRATLLKMAAGDIFAPDELPRLRVDFRRTRPTNPSSREGRLRHKSGRLITVELFSQALNFNGKKATLVALQKTEESPANDDFRVALDLSLEAFAILKSIRDAHGKIVDFEWTYANKAAGLILKHPPRELVGKRLLDVLPRNRENMDLFNRYARIVETGKGDEVELNYVSDGIDGWFRNMTVKFGDGVAVLFSDITAYKKAEEIVRQNRDELERAIAKQTLILQNANERLRQEIVEHKRLADALRDSESGLKQSQQIAHVGHWTWDTTTNRVVWSEEMRRIFGIDPEAFDGDLNRIIAQTIHPDDREKVFQANARVIVKQKTPPLEYRVVWPDGSIHTVWAVPGECLLDDDGKVLKLSGIVQDVTERKQVEETLRIAEADYRVIFDEAPIGIFRSTPGGQIIKANLAMAKMYGYTSPEELIAEVKSIPKQLYPDPSRRDEIVRLLSIQGEAHDFETQNSRKDGSVFWISINARAVRDASGSIIQYEGFIEDISERKRADDILKINDARQRLLLELHQRVDAPAQELLDFALEASLQITFSEYAFIGFLDESETEMTIQSMSKQVMAKCATEGTRLHIPISEAGLLGACVREREIVIVNDYGASHPAKVGTPEGHVQINRFLSIPVFDGNRIVMLAMVANKKDKYIEADSEPLIELLDRVWVIWRRKQAEDRLRQSEARYDQLARHIPIGIYILHADKDGILKFEYVSPPFCQILGVDEKTVLGDANRALDNVYPEDRESLIQANQNSARRMEPHLWEGRLMVGGEERWIRIETDLTPLPSGGSLWNGVVQDITDRKRIEIELLYARATAEAANGDLQEAYQRERIIAGVDYLTEIYNRRNFFEFASYEFEIAKRYQTPLSLILFDIDHFKQVNDTWGHQTGDTALKNVVQIAREQLRSADIIARYGGEEFIVLLPNTNAKEAAMVAERIRENIAAHQMETERGIVNVTVSIGIAELHANVESLDQFILNADDAMYAAKGAGRNRAVVFK